MRQWSWHPAQLETQKQRRKICLLCLCSRDAFAFLWLLLEVLCPSPEAEVADEAGALPVALPE